MACVYSHIRNDSNKVFYIGIGVNAKRAYNKTNRNDYWKSIVRKHGYVVKLLHTNIDIRLAKELEQFYISKHGIDNLANMTKGGDGSLGLHHKTASKLKLRLINTGKTLSQLTKSKISRAMLGKKNRLGTKHSKHTKQLMSQQRMGHKVSESTRLKLSIANKGHKMTLEQRIKLSISKRKTK